MNVRFDGAQPTADEIAALIAVLTAAQPAAQHESEERMPAWRMAGLLPDLSLDDVREYARSGLHVP